MQRVSDVKIEAVVGCLPDNIVDNIEDCKELYGIENAQTIVKATGFYKRAIAKEGTSSLDLCVRAAEYIFENSKIKKEEIGGVIFITFTPHYRMIASSSIAQDRLGLGKEILSFDINLACSGYVYGLNIAALLARQTGKKILLLDGDVQSHIVSKQDKGTLPVLADAGSASIISPSEKSSDDWQFDFYTDGSGADALKIVAGGSYKPLTKDDLDYKQYGGDKRRNIDITMDGFAVFKFVAMTVSSKITEFVNNSNSSISEYSAFVPHQANMFMIGQLAKKIGIEKDKMWTSGELYGNSASATVPVTIAQNGHKLEKKSKVLLAAFGAGLSVAVGSVNLEKDALYKNIFL